MEVSVQAAALTSRSNTPANVRRWPLTHPRTVSVTFDFCYYRPVQTRCFIWQTCANSLRIKILPWPPSPRDAGCFSQCCKNQLCMHLCVWQANTLLHATTSSICCYATTSQPRVCCGLKSVQKLHHRLHRWNRILLHCIHTVRTKETTAPSALRRNTSWRKQSHRCQDERVWIFPAAD